MRYRRLIEIQNATACGVVGIVFIANSILHGNMYERSPDTYYYMEELSSWMWGIGYLSLSLLHLSFLYFALRRARKLLLLFKATAWFFLGFCVVRGDFYAPSGWIYFVFTVTAAVCYWKIREHSDDYYELSIPPNI